MFYRTLTINSEVCLIVFSILHLLSTRDLPSYQVCSSSPIRPIREVAETRPELSRPGLGTTDEKDL